LRLSGYTSLPQRRQLGSNGHRDGSGARNPPSWSVGIEWIAYFAFPFLIWGTARWSDKPWLPIIPIVIIGLVLNSQIPQGLSRPEGVTRGLS